MGNVTVDNGAVQQVAQEAMRMQWDCVVFDLDGTILDSHQYTFEAFRHAVAPWRQGLGDQQIHAAFGPSEHIILQQFVPAADVDAAYARLQEFYQQHVDEVRTLAGIRSVLEELATHGVKRGLFTGRGLDSTQLLLHHHKLAGLFDAVVAGDAPCRPKPSGEGIQRLLQQVHCRPERTLVVGDSRLDLQAAAAAGTSAVGASWFTSPARSGIEGPTLGSCTDLRLRLGMDA